MEILKREYTYNNPYEEISFDFIPRYLLARRHLVNDRNREELDEVSNKRLTNMAYDIAAGLAFLAEQKYVHRDVACRNCLVNAGRSVKLADFGMTRPMFESDYYRFSRRGKKNPYSNLII